MAAILAMAAIGTWAISTHRVSYVITRGVSMQPTYSQGDLVFVIKSHSYESGQIAAYHSPDGTFEVLHRIIGGDADSGYVLKGDNNAAVDPPKPTAAQIIGKAVLHIPKGGTWLQPILSPTGLGMIGFLFFGAGTALPNNRRNIPRGHRKKRVKGMSGGGGSFAMATAIFKAVSRLHPALRAVAYTAAIAGISGLALGILGWMKPVTETASSGGTAGESMTFSYSAEVPQSAAYDGTTVHSPDPVFRRLAQIVNLHMAYTGRPGRIQVIARLSSQSGWHKTLQLSQQKQFTTNRYTGETQLDLQSLQQIAVDAGKAIGAEMGPITLALTAQIRHSDGSAFDPQLSLNLAPLALTLAGSAESLAVDKSSTSATTSIRDRQIGAFGYEIISALAARRYAVYLLLGAILGAAIVAMMALRHVPLRTRTQIERRYPHLLVPVEPMASPPGKPIVVVDAFPALVKLAEKYGQMILTWTRPDGADDFVVRDEGILYRYRIEPAPAPAIPAKVERQPAAASPSGRVAAEPGAVPVLQLPPAPETPPELQDDQPEGEEPAPPEDAPAKVTAPRKRTSRTAAAKAAAKTTATKATPAKRAAAKAPAKRTRAQAKAAGTPVSEAAAAVSPEVGVSSDEPGRHTDIAGGPEASQPDVPADSSATDVPAEAVVATAEQVPTAEASDPQDATRSIADESGTSPAPDSEPKAQPESTSDLDQFGQGPAEAATELETLTPEQTSPAQAEALAIEPDALRTEHDQVAAAADAPAAEQNQVEPEPDALTASQDQATAVTDVLTADQSQVGAEPDALSADQDRAATETKEAPTDPDEPAAESESSPAQAMEAASEPEPNSSNPDTDTETDTAEPASHATETDRSTIESKGTAPESAGPTDLEIPGPEPVGEAIQPEPTDTTETAQEEARTAPETDSPPSRSQQRTGRRKGRSRRSPKPAMDEPPVADRPTEAEEPLPGQPTAVGSDAPAHEAREAMTDLADRNRPITTPEPAPRAKPEPVHEPIYDFLPAAKRIPSPPELDDEPEP
ncbi:S24 family peptidase [Actinoplanes sp. NPDC026670]|uniref:S24 family peptidase n=1 Tax=Actinoplanes sp. NPDC026670 TaxID=3154700 RepID=UPI00340A7F8B